MVLPMIFGLLILVVVVYITFRIFGNLLHGALLIGLIFIASFLILGSLPNLKEVPLIGDFLPDLSNLSISSATGNVINVVRNLLYNLKILSVGRSSSGNLLILVANAGRLDVSNFSVSVDGNAASIVNMPKDPLKSGESTVIETGWKGKFDAVIVKTQETVANYTLSSP
jgi:hypothetical protein